MPARERALLLGVAKALLKLVATLAALSIVTFAATNAIPGDPARTALGRTATAEQLEAFREQQGLNEPVVERYFSWVGGFLRGDWGRSLISDRPVKEDVQVRLGRTLALALASFFLVALPVGIALGLWSGRRAGTLPDRAVSMATLVVTSLPEFVIGICLLVVFAVWLGWFAVESSAIAFGPDLGELIRLCALPVLTLALTVIPYVSRMMRANARDVVATPYVRAAELKGVRGLRLSLRHVLPNALPPVVNVLALNLAELIAGVVVVEAVFGFPGAGQLLVTAVQTKDLATVQALTLLIGAAFVTCNLLADLVVLALNPRLRTATA